MLRNYLKIALRSLKRQKGYSFINILGLSVGLACCILLTLWVLDELDYDTYNTKADRIYRVTTTLKNAGNEHTDPGSGAMAGPTFMRDYPDVEAMVRLRQRGSTIVKRGNTVFKEPLFVFADSSFFDVFTVDVLQGDPRTALTQPMCIAISESTARKYFGSQNPIGEPLFFGEYPFKVTAVFKEIPQNSHFHFNIIASLGTLTESINKYWLETNFYTYLLLKKGVNPDALAAKINQSVPSYISPELPEAFGVSYEEYVKKGNGVKFGLQPLLDIHLKSNSGHEIEPNGDILYVYIFSASAILILVLACINFMNLSIARSSTRAKEVGIRKVSGSGRQQLLVQFLSESVMLTCLSLVVSVILVLIVLPFFNTLSSKQINFSLLENWTIVPALLGFVLLIGILTGLYPALFLSSFVPVQVLKGKFSLDGKTNWFRSGLVVFQFSISIILIIGTVVISKQLNYIKQKRTGYDKEQVVVLHDTHQLGNKVKLFKQEMLNTKNVTHATVSGFLPAGHTDNVSTVCFAGNSINPNGGVSVEIYTVDHDYIATLGMRIVNGRGFSEKFITDSSAVVINQTAAKELGYRDPLGKTIATYGQGPGEVVTYRIIGVVEDFHFKSMHEKISPLCMRLGQAPHFNNISFKVAGADVQGFVRTLQERWKVFAPGQPFEYSFLDERFEQTYRVEERVGQVFSLFSTLAIFIGCLGLMGLASFTAQQRTKEIGIRKVLGASVGGILFLLSRDFLKLIFIAFLIAAPVSYYGASRWLADFAYRTEISWWIFIAAGLLATTVALLVVAVQTLKVALTNPTKSLRSE